MPHFTRQIDAKGPLLNVQLTVSAARHAALTAAQVPIPEPFGAQGLVDTGASSTCIDPSVVKHLGLSPSGKAQVYTPSTGEKAVSVDQYDIGLSIYSTTTEPPYRIPNLAVMESELLAGQGFHTLIGRDVLARCLLVYNGATGLYTLAF